MIKQEPEQEQGCFEERDSVEQMKLKLLGTLPCLKPACMNINGSSHDDVS